MAWNARFRACRFRPARCDRVAVRAASSGGSGRILQVASPALACGPDCDRGIRPGRTQPRHRLSAADPASMEFHGAGPGDAPGRVSGPEHRCAVERQRASDSPPGAVRDAQDYRGPGGLPHRQVRSAPDHAEGAQAAAEAGLYGYRPGRTGPIDAALMAAIRAWAVGVAARAAI